MAHIQLFISAVTAEFRSYRDSLRNHLTQPDVSVAVQEDFLAGTKTLQKLDHYIKHCTAVIHLVGNATGASAGEPSLSDLETLYPDLAARLPALKQVIETGTPRLSYTQWAAYLAIYHRKPLLIAVPEAEEQRDQSIDADQRAAQQAHLERLEALGHYAEIKFANADRLVIAVLRSQPVQAGLFPQLRPPVDLPKPPPTISGKQSKKVFISYRRDDSRYQAHRIFEAFKKKLSRENVFMDIDSIPLGHDFVDVLKEWVGQCEIFLALVGPGWVSCSDPQTGKLRLDNPNDFVRVEIREALARGIPVVPVLIDGASMPDEKQLPEDLRLLARRHAEFVDFRTFDPDVRRLIKKLGITGTRRRATANK